MAYISPHNCCKLGNNNKKKEELNPPPPNLQYSQSSHTRFAVVWYSMAIELYLLSLPTSPLKRVCKRCFFFLKFKQIPLEFPFFLSVCVCVCYYTFSPNRPNLAMAKLLGLGCCELVQRAPSRLQFSSSFRSYFFFAPAPDDERDPKINSFRTSASCVSPTFLIDAATNRKINYTFSFFLRHFLKKKKKKG